MLWLGIDVGTTHIKALLYGDDVGTLGSAVEPTPVELTRDGMSRAPAEVSKAVFRVVHEVLTRTSAKRSIGGLAIASVGEEIVPIDGHGAPVTEVPVWHDPRGSVEARAFVPTDLHRRFPPDPSSSLFKLLWLADHDPSPFRRAVRYLDLSSFLLTQFGAPPMMDWSHASRTGVFDPSKLAWDDETISAAHLPAAAFCELVPSGTVVGQLDPAVARVLGLQPSMPLVAGGHDHFVGAFASGVRHAGDLYLSAGTSEAQLVLGDEPLSDGAPGRIDQGRFVDDRHWYAHKSAPCGQLHGQWRNLLYRDDPDAVEAEVRTASVPDGMRLDLDEDERTASLIGVPTTASRGTIMRAVEEGSAVATGRVFRVLERAMGHPVRRVVVAGHATTEERWLSLRAGLLERDLDVVVEPEVTALGAALLARRGVTGDAGPSAMTFSRVVNAADIALASNVRARHSPHENDAPGKREGAK